VARLHIGLPELVNDLFGVVSFFRHGADLLYSVCPESLWAATVVERQAIGPLGTDLGNGRLCQASVLLKVIFRPNHAPSMAPTKDPADTMKCCSSISSIGD